MVKSGSPCVSASAIKNASSRGDSGAGSQPLVVVPLAVVRVALACLFFAVTLQPRRDGKPCDPYQVVGREFFYGDRSRLLTTDARRVTLPRVAQPSQARPFRVAPLQVQ